MRFGIGGLLAAVALAQQAPPSIVVENVPEVPSDLVRKLTPYQNVRTADFRSWHPDRREILITTRFGDVAQVHGVRAPGGYLALSSALFGRVEVPLALG